MVTLFSWDTGTLPTTFGGTVVSDADVGLPTTPSLRVDSSDAASFARWEVTARKVVALRFYFRTPEAWPASSCNLVYFRQNSASMVCGAAFSGTSAPGQLRLTKIGGVVILATPSNTLQLSTDYRIELQYDGDNERCRLALFEMGANLPTWESGWQTDEALNVDVIRIEIGRVNNSPNTFAFWIDSVMGTDEVTNYIGKHAEDGSGGGPPPESDFPREWSGGALPDVVGNVTLDSTWGHPTQPSLKIEQAVSATAYVNYDHTVPSMEIAARCYVKMPAAWPSAAWSLITLRPTSATFGASLNLSGSGQPGQLRLVRQGGNNAIQSPSNTLTAGKLYRFEIRYNANAEMARVAAFPQGLDIPVWDSGWVAHADFGAAIGVTQFGRVNNNPQVGVHNLDGLFVNNTSIDWVGRLAGDNPAAATVKVWNGTSLVTPTGVKVWDGTTLKTVTQTFGTG